MINRSHLLFIASFCAFISSLIVAFATYQEATFVLRGYVNATQDSNLPYRLPRLGVNVDLTQYDEYELHRQLRLMEEAKIVWLRQIVDWRALEPRQGEFKWNSWDILVSAVDNTPLRLVVVFMNTPEWAYEGDYSYPTTPPDDFEDFLRFVRTFIERYGHSIDYYQVWDEPNIRIGWGNRDPNPVEYTALLCSTYQVIHSQDPHSIVIAAALAPTVETGPRNINEVDYLRHMYANGAGDCLDAVAAKPYGFNSSPLDRTVDLNVLNFSRVIALREVMVANGDSRKSLWASNWGWNSLPEDWDGEPSIWGSVASQNQIDYTKAAFERAQREWPWLGGFILQHWQPNLPLKDPSWGFTLIDPHYRPTLLYEAIKTLGQQESVATNGLYHPANTYARYSGVWTFGPLGADIGWLEKTDSYVEFDFYGSEIALLLRKDDYIAFLYPKIDGQPANAVPHDSSGRAYIFLRSATLLPEQTLVLTAQNLALAQHTLSLIPDKGWDRWALAGFAVSSGDLAKPYNNQLVIATVVVAISFIATILALRQLSWYLTIPKIITRLSAVWHLAVSFMISFALMISMLITWGQGTPQFLRRDQIQLGLALISVGLIYLEPPFIITLFSALFLFVLIYNRLETGLILTLFWAPFYLFPIELWRFAFPIAEVTMALTTAAWLLKVLDTWGKMRQNGVEVNWAKQIVSNIQLNDLFVFAWLFLGSIALTWSFYTRPAFTEFRVLFIEPILFYVILRTLPPNSYHQSFLLDTLIISASAVSIIGFIMFIFGQGIITAEAGTLRLASIYGSPNNLALLLGRAIPVALAFALISIDKKRRLFGIIAVILMIIALLLTQSVGGIIFGLPAAIVTISLIHWGRRALVPLMILSIIGIIGIIVATQLSPRFAGLFDMTRGTNFFRLRVWESAVDIISDYPLTGIGLDQFLYRFRSEYIRPDAIWDRDLSHPHNFILDIWTRLGIIGIGLFIGIQMVFWRQLRRLLASNPSPLTRATLAGLAGGMMVTLTHGLIDNSIFVIDLAYIFFAQLGTVAIIANMCPIDLNTS